MIKGYQEKGSEIVEKLLNDLENNYILERSQSEIDNIITNIITIVAVQEQTISILNSEINSLIKQFDI